MGIIAVTSTMMLLTVGAGYLLWTLLLQFESINTAAESGMPHARRAALLFLALAGVSIVGTLAVVLVEVQQLFTPASL